MRGVEIVCPRQTESAVLFNKVKNGKAAGPTGVVSETVKAA